MTDTQAAELFTATERFANRRRLDPELTAIAIVLAWWYATLYKGDEKFPVSHWARLGVRGARNGRDLPGVKSIGRVEDALDIAWRCGAMNEARDHWPGPAKIAEDRDACRFFMESLSDTEQRIADAFEQGLSNNEVARRLKRTAGTISQRRKRLAERYRKQG